MLFYYILACDIIQSASLLSIAKLSAHQSKTPSFSGEIPLAKSPQQVADKWATNLGGAATAIKDGVNGVTTAPTALAAAAEGRYISGVQAAVASGKWQAGLNRVSLQDWKDSMLQKGLARVGPGAAAAKGKFAAFMQQLLPYQQQLIASLPPRGDLNANIQRMVAMAQGMHNFRRS